MPLTIKFGTDPVLLVVQKEQLAQSAQLSSIQASLASIQAILKAMQLTDDQIKTLLAGIDTTTNKIAANVQTIADVDQTISNEMDAFIAAHPAGTTFTDDEVTQLQSFADRLQKTSDASDAQVTVLQAIAAKGGTTVPAAPPAPSVS
jgi:hypothetical protein